MKKQLLHQNLDTSFVNLAALLRYLRKRQFAGQITVSLNEYEAEILLDESGSVKAREHDRLTARRAEGEQALARIMIRSREPGGVVNVYQYTEAGATSHTEIIEVVEASPAAQPVLAAEPIRKPPFPVGTGERRAVPRRQQPQPTHQMPSAPHARQTAPDKAASAATATASPPTVTGNGQNPNGNGHAKPLAFPINLSNGSEKAKEKIAQLSPQDWQELLTLSAVLLNSIDKSLASAGLGFAEAFAKARAEVSSDYPFLHPVTGAFVYDKGRVSLKQKVNDRLMVAGLNECLRRITQKLSASPKFLPTYIEVSRVIQSLISQHRPRFDKFGFTRQLERIIGS